VRYQELIPMLVNELQRERQEIQQQADELANLRALVQELRAGRSSGAAARARP